MKELNETVQLQLIKWHSSMAFSAMILYITSWLKGSPVPCEATIKSVTTKNSVSKPGTSLKDRMLQ